MDLTTSIHDTKLLDLIKQSSLILRSYFSWLNHLSILFSLTGLSFNLVLVDWNIFRSCLH